MKLPSKSKIDFLAKKFGITGQVTDHTDFGSGHINRTYLVTVETGSNDIERYILQAINSHVFKNIYDIMENIAHVTEHLKKKISETEKVLTFLKTEEGNLYFVDEEGLFWRMYAFIDDAICLQLPETDTDFYECAVAFGKFQRHLSDFPADILHETIPDFHNTQKRYETFLAAVEKDDLNRASSVQDEINFVTAREEFYPLLEKEYRAGNLPHRVSHNDTKCNNVLLDKTTRKSLCVIDLDTIMPGFSVTDFGDAIRFGASTAAEDERDLFKVHFDMEKFKVYTKGFLDGCGGLLTDREILLLPEGAKMMTVECGMRFLTDYLEGDIYFRTDREGQNLDRCRTQFRLVEEMEEHWQEMKDFVSTYVAK